MCVSLPVLLVTHPEHFLVSHNNSGAKGLKPLGGSGDDDDDGDIDDDEDDKHDDGFLLMDIRYRKITLLSIG